MVLGGIYGGVDDAVGINRGGRGRGAGHRAGAMRRFRWPAGRIAAPDHRHLGHGGVVIVVTGIMFTRFMVHTNVTADDVAMIASWNLGRTSLLLAMLRAVLHPRHRARRLGMLILSLPFVMPLMATAGVDKVWFGIFLCVMMELAAVSPPVGITGGGDAQRGARRADQRDLPRLLTFLGLTILLTFALIA